MKRWLLVVIVLLSCFVALVSCSGDGELDIENSTKGLVYNISADGQYVEITGYNGVDNDVIIPNEYEGLPVRAIADSAFAFTNISSVVIPDSVTSLGDWAFAYCSELKEFDLPKSVTEIGYWAFIGCTSLEYVNIPKGVSEIGYQTFKDCSSLIEITVPEGVKTIHFEAFAGCSSLREITLPFVGSVYGQPGNSHIGFVFGANTYEKNAEFIPATLENISITNDVVIRENSFYRCANLKNIEISGGVESIGDSAFYGCSNLTSIEIPDSVTSIGDSAFSGCPGLTSIKIPDSVTSIGDSAFSGCSGLTSIEIPSGVRSIGDSAFSGCSGITSTEIPSGVSSIGDSAFSGCSGLTSIKIPDSVTSIGNSAFSECSLLTGIKYCGTEKQWNAISKGQDWDSNTGNYTITYNYTSE